MSEWISVKNKLPDNKTTVRVRSKSFRQGIANFVLCKNGEPFFDVTPWEKSSGFSPTEWMPLPEPPDEVK